MSARVTLTGGSTGHGIPPMPGIVSHGSVHYDTRADELIIEISEQVAVRLSPGRDMAEAIRVLMERVDDTRKPIDDASDEACYGCGATVIMATTQRGKIIMLDIEPNESGAYVIAGNGTARPLRPFEEPIGLTYRKHICRGGR